VRIETYASIGSKPNLSIDVFVRFQKADDEDSIEADDELLSDDYQFTVLLKQFTEVRFRYFCT